MGFNISKSNITALFAAILLFFACAKPAPQENNRLKVAVTSYAAYSLAQEVLRGIADITMLIPPGSEAHSFEPSPQTALNIRNADFFFYISPVMEPWADKLSDGKGIALAYNLPGQDTQKNPHVWMDFDNAAVMANYIATYVARRYPDLEKPLAANVAAFNRELAMLDRMYSQMLRNCKTRDIYHVGHSAFGNLAAKYKLNFKPLTGTLSDQEPSPKELALMVKEIKANNIPYIFTEEELSPKLANTVANETKTGVLELYTIEHITKKEWLAKTTYKQFMVMNLDSLRKGLNCELD